MSQLPLCVMLLPMTLQGVFAAEEDQTITVMEGDSVTLHTNLTQIQTEDHVSWRLKNNTLLAEVYKRYNKSQVYDIGIYRDKVKLDDQTGSLTITNISTAHSTLYKLEMINQHGTLNKRFSVVVSHRPDLVINRDCSSPSICWPFRIDVDYKAVMIIAAAAFVFITVAVIAFRCNKPAGQVSSPTEETASDEMFL